MVTRRPLLIPLHTRLADDLLPVKLMDEPDDRAKEAPLIVEKKHRDGFTVIYVEGLIKLGESAEFFSQALENVLKNESGNVMIDFTKIDYIDSTGIGELVGYLGKFSNQNRKLILINPSERILKLLKLAKLDSVFKIYSTEDEAIGAEETSSRTESEPGEAATET